MPVPPVSVLKIRSKIAVVVFLYLYRYCISGYLYCNVEPHYGTCARVKVKMYTCMYDALPLGGKLEQQSQKGISFVPLYPPAAPVSRS
jgi:hypothetical protein